ncbi:ectD [Acrasis kona]|uniref:EctD n=1 Tax=Acrasis kona TaxID=1008807 RepID=A0AAW2YJM1_9EUKA
MIPRLNVPRDDDDYNYTKSFFVNDTEQIKDFFNEYGFVVVRNVLSQQDCDNTVTEIFDILESDAGWQRDDMTTWNQWPTNGMPQFGSPSRPPVFSSQFLKNRINPNVHKVFSTLLQDEDLIVNHDRCCLYRPTLNVPTSTGVVPSMKKWKTLANLHLDMSPSNYLSNNSDTIIDNYLSQLRYRNVGNFITENNQVGASSGTQLQGVINLVDNHEQDGGFQVVPGFHKIFDKYFENTALDNSTQGHNFGRNDVIQKYSIRVPLRAGSIVVWNQKMPHGSLPNNSSRMRCAQFIKMFPSKQLLCHRERADARRAVVRRNVDVLQDFEMTELGECLFDL